jgi:hypothetical protein
MVFFLFGLPEPLENPFRSGARMADLSRLLTTFRQVVAKSLAHAYSSSCRNPIKIVGGDSVVNPAVWLGASYHVFAAVAIDPSTLSIDDPGAVLPLEQRDVVARAASLLVAEALYTA